jgi:hypothetical protein
MRTRRILPIVAGIVTTLALAPGNAGAQREPLLVDTTLDYVCAEVGPVTVRVTATLPATGKIGEPVEPSRAGIEVSVPAAALAGLPGAATVTSVTRLEVSSETWSAVLSDPVPLADPAVLAGEVTAPPVTPSEAGDLVFSAGNLIVTVTGYTADGVKTEPPSVSLTCVLDPAESAELAVVPVGAPDKGTASVPPPTAGEGVPKGPGSLAVAAAPPPPECYKLTGNPTEYTDSFCAYMTGYSNVKKLNASVLQPPGIVNINATKFIRVCAEGTGILCQKALVLPELNGKPQLPPAPASFFAFGFIPTTGTMQLTQIGLADVYLWSTSRPPYRGLATVKVKLSAQISDVKINGVPLDVGDDCRTAEPINGVFTGTYDEYSISKGGVLRGTVTIPPFSGCGVSEDLDPIFTGLVSGPGNYVKLTQGAVCTVGGNNNGCPPVKPVPIR